MYHKPFGGRDPPRPSGGAYTLQRSPSLLAGLIGGPTGKGKRKGEWEGWFRGGMGKERMRIKRENGARKGGGSGKG